MYLCLSVAPCVFLPGGAASAQVYPVKPIHWIVPFAPGGPTDIMSRAIGEKLVQQWGQQIVVDNKGGAGGNIGAELTAKSAPDGYTVMIGHVGTHAINVALYPSTPEQFAQLIKVEVPRWKNVVKESGAKVD